MIRNRKPIFFIGSGNKPSEIRLDLNVDQLSKIFGSMETVLKYMDGIKTKLQKAFPFSKVTLGKNTIGEPVWFISGGDGTELKKAQVILDKYDKLFE
jgi:hypothetical protein